MNRPGWTRLAIATLVVTGAVACSRRAGEVAVPPGAPEVAATVRDAHAAVDKATERADPSAFEDARRGFIAAPSGQVRDADGRLIWDFDAYAFVKGKAPATVNPSLWRQALLNNHAGLFKVTDGIWQLRGFDLANMTLVEGRSGWIVIDTLTARETAAAALAFARRHLGDRPVSAVVFTHSHVDHFGGALGVVSAEEAKARQLPVVVPQGFLEEATSENLLVGTAMARRATFMYGNRLHKGPAGAVDNGLGKGVAFGRVGILPPTRVVDRPAQEMTIDGRRFVFHLVPGTEAPAEFVFSLPDFKAFCGAELMGHTLHNLYPLRGAKVRDALKWADGLDRSLEWAADAEVVFNQHHWPVWGRERIREFVGKQRDAYRYIHDQSVRMINAGLTASEIAEQLTLPRSLQEFMSVRGYYGTVSHNAKAIYQHYIGWFDGHPANLHALPPQQAAQGYVALAGGAGKLLAEARKAFDAGNFRWAAELLRHAVLADGGNRDAAELLARSLEQMGYAAESAPWRNVYLSGALELRQGPPAQGISLSTYVEMLEHTPTERLLERMAAAIDGRKAAEADGLVINLRLSDRAESYVLSLENGVLHHRAAPPAPGAKATLTLSRGLFVRLMTGQAGAKDLLLSGQARIDGSALELARFFSMIERAAGDFPVVTR